MKPETAIVAAVIEAVNASGLAFVWRNQSGVVRVKRGFMHLAPKGSPDIVGWNKAGHFVAFEVKTENGVTGKARKVSQAEWRTRISQTPHGICAEVRSATEAIEILKAAA